MLYQNELLCFRLQKPRSLRFQEHTHKGVHVKSNTVNRLVYFLNSRLILVLC